MIRFLRRLFRLRRKSRPATMITSFFGCGFNDGEETSYCQMCHDTGIKTPATFKDGDGVALCEACRNDCMNTMGYNQ